MEDEARTVVFVVLILRVRWVVVVLKMVTSAASSELSSGVSGSEWCVNLALVRSAAMLDQLLASLVVAN